MVGAPAASRLACPSEGRFLCLPREREKGTEEGTEEERAREGGREGEVGRDRAVRDGTSNNVTVFLNGCGPT